MIGFSALCLYLAVPGSARWIGLGLGWESLNASLLEEEGSISLIVLISFWEANTPHLLVLYQMGFMAPTRGNLTRV